MKETIINNLDELKELLIDIKTINIKKIKYSDSLDKEEMINYLKDNIDNSNYAWFLGCCYLEGQCVKKDEKEAIKYFKMSADKGNERAQCFLGVCYGNGKGVDQDYNEALKYYKLAADQGNALAQFGIGYFYENGYGVDQDYNEAFKYYKLSANQENDMAQYSIGELYEKGLGVDQDYNKAFKYYKLAADQGNTLARFELGYLYEKGLGVEQNYNEAFKYFKLAADQNNVTAQQNIGVFYENGYGVEQNYSKAFKYYKLAADQGNVRAQKSVGYFYTQGLGVDQDPNEAFKYFKLAADQNDSFAQSRVGVFYENGEGVDQDSNEAFKYFKLAADQGDIHGQYFLGFCYVVGHGTEKNNNEAFKYFKLAADRGYAIAQWHVGLFYQYGWDTEINFSYAIEYYKKAINQNYNVKECYENMSKCYLTGGYGIDKDIVLANAYHYMSEGTKEITALLLACVNVFDNNGNVPPPLFDSLEMKLKYILDHGEIVAEFYLDKIRKIRENDELSLINSKLTLEEKQSFSIYLTTEPKDLFISWNHKDKKFKDAISNYLSSNGIGVWDSDKNCYGVLDKILFHAIKISRCYLLILTKNSVKSKWVHAELDCAIRNNKQIYIIVDEGALKIVNKLDKNNRFYQVLNSKESALGSKILTKVEKKQIIKNNPNILDNILNVINDNLLQNDFINIKNKIDNENKVFKYTLCNLISENIIDYVNTITTLDDGYIERTLLDENNNNVNINDIDLNNNIFIYGHGGSGKSIIIKKINTMINGNYIPIELNNLNLLEFEDFNSLVDNELKHKSKYENANIDYILKNNINTYFILDGLDELLEEERKHLSKIIQLFKTKYLDNVYFIISSRNSNHINLFNTESMKFKKYTIKNLDKEDIEELYDLIKSKADKLSFNPNKEYCVSNILNYNSNNIYTIINQITNYLFGENHEIKSKSYEILEDSVNISLIGLEESKDSAKIRYSCLSDDIDFVDMFSYLAYANAVSNSTNKEIIHTYFNNNSREAQDMYKYLIDRQIIKKYGFIHQMYLEYFCSLYYVNSFRLNENKIIYLNNDRKETLENNINTYFKINESPWNNISLDTISGFDCFIKKYEGLVSLDKFNLIFDVLKLMNNILTKEQKEVIISLLNSNEFYFEDILLEIFKNK